jgi:hypothetical protein
MMPAATKLGWDTVNEPGVDDTLSMVYGEIMTVRRLIEVYSKVWAVPFLVLLS